MSANLVSAMTPVTLGTVLKAMVYVNAKVISQLHTVTDATLGIINIQNVNSVNVSSMVQGVLNVKLTTVNANANLHMAANFVGNAPRNILGTQTALLVTAILWALNPVCASMNQANVLAELTLVDVNVTSALMDTIVIQTVHSANVMPVELYPKFVTKELGCVFVKRGMMEKDVTDASRAIMAIPIVDPAIVVTLEVCLPYVMPVENAHVFRILQAALVTSAVLDIIDTLSVCPVTVMLMALLALVVMPTVSVSVEETLRELDVTDAKRVSIISPIVKSATVIRLVSNLAFLAVALFHKESYASVKPESKGAYVMNASQRTGICSNIIAMVVKNVIVMFRVQWVV